MQYILSVDATTQPAQAVIVRVEGKIVEIVERREIDLGSRLAEPRAEAAVDSSGEEDAVAPGSSDAEGSLDEGTVPKASRTIATTREEVFGTPEYPTGGLLDAGPVNLHEALETPWSNAIVIVPPEDYLSLNLELPFADSRNISKILDLEVQDVVPFDVSEFLLQHQSIGPLSASSFDVHVSAVPKTYLRRVLGACRHFGIEPLIISTPSSIAGALFHIAPDYFAKNSAIVVAQDPFYYVTSCFEGQIRSERLIRRNQPWLGVGKPARGGDSEENAEQGLLLDVRMTIASMEHRYGKQVECLYLVESSRPVWRDVSDLKQAVGRNVERINLTEMGRSLESHTALAGIAAVFAQDVDAPTILTNFRTREFSYSPPLKEVMAGLRRLLPLFVSGALLFVLTLISVYYLRERHSDKLHDAMIEEIRAAVPDMPLEEGNELQQLQRQNAALDEQLKDLGSPSSLSPLDILLEISRDFPVSSDTYLTAISVRGTHLKIDGVAPNYAAVDKIEKALSKRKKSLYCRIKKDTGSYSQSPGARSFTFDIWMCE